MQNIFQKHLSEMDWLLPEDAYDHTLLNTNESLLTIGNGYIGSRGVYEEKPTHTLPGTFFAGIFDEVGGHVSELINAPNPFYLALTSENKEKLDIALIPVAENKRVLDLRKGLLLRETVFGHPDEQWHYQSLRFISQHNLNVAVMQVILTPLHKPAHFTVECAIDTAVINKGIVLHEDRRLFDLRAMEQSEHIYYLSVESLDGQKEIAYGQKVIADIDGEIRVITQNNFELALKKNQSVIITKYITFFATKNQDERGVLRARVAESLEGLCHAGFEETLAQHVQAFDKRWYMQDIKLVGDGEAQIGLRFYLYHLLIAFHPGIHDRSIGAKLLTGEGYKGHIFWETELLLIPCYLFANPELAKTLLEYRFNRLEAAKQIAAGRGFKGALYPWESADTGYDSTPPWSEDLDTTIKIVHTGKESIHINVAIFYALYQYFCMTCNIEFMLNKGLTMALQMARFWKSRVVHNKKHDVYKIKHVMGPDEFHEDVSNNAYTNKLVAWSLDKTLEWLEFFQTKFPAKTALILKQNKFYLKEKNKLKKIAKRIWIPTQDKIMLQFDRFQKLKFLRTPTLDAFGLPNLPSDLLVVDLYKTQFIKQADVVLLLLLLPFYFDQKTIETNFHYYDARTLHKSSWSPPIYSAVAARLNFIERAYHYFSITLNIDRKNIYNNTKEGIHAPAAGGAWIAMVFGFCGIRIFDNYLVINPHFPRHWQLLHFKFHYLDFILTIMISPSSIKITSTAVDHLGLTSQSNRPTPRFVRVKVGKKIAHIYADKEYEFPIVTTYS